MWNQKIKKILDKGMNQTELASFVGVSQGYISRMKSGLKEDPRQSVAVKIDELYALAIKKK